MENSSLEKRGGIVLIKTIGDCRLKLQPIPIMIQI